MRNNPGSTRRFGSNSAGCGFGSGSSFGGDWSFRRGCRFGRDRSFGRRFGQGLFLLRFFFLSNLLGVVVVHDAGYIVVSFAKRRHSLILLDALRTRVVSGQRFYEIEIVALQKFTEITASGADVGLRIEGIVHAQLVGGTGHQLHQSASAFR